MSFIGFYGISDRTDGLYLGRVSVDNILQGPTGPPGIQGDTGSQGIQGDTGSQGNTGSQGPTGIQGDTGSQGIQGDTGSQGIQGDTGSQGPTGSFEFNITDKYVLLSNGTGATGASDFTHKANTGVITVGENLSYTSTYPIGIECAFDDDTYCSGIIVQNKNSADGASAHILVQNDLGTDSSYYADFGINSSGSTIQYNQFATMPNGVSLTSQSSNLIFTPNAGGQGDPAQVSNIFLTYNNGAKAHFIDDYGRLIIGANNPSYSGDTYGGNDGGVGNVLQSNGIQGLIYAPNGGFSAYRNCFIYNNIQSAKSGITINLFERLNQDNIIPELRMLFKCIFNFSITNASPNITFDLIQIDGVNENLLQSFVQSFSRNGHHSYPINFNWVVDPDLYVLSFKIRATVSSGTISTDISDYVSVEVLQLQNTA